MVRAGRSGENGTGILLHRRWAKGFQAFHAASDRVCAVDVEIEGQKIRLIAVYMPHCGKDDAEVEGAYLNLDALVLKARQLNRVCVLAGDWNAVAGPWQVGDDEAVVGEHGVGTRNSRGEWFVQWASLRSLTIASTMIPKCFEDQWTYENGGVRRQLDYSLIDTAQDSWVVDAGACDAIGLGCEHRAVSLVLALPRSGQNRGPSQRPRPGRNRNMRGWQPVSGEDYRNKVDEVAAAQGRFGRWFACKLGKSLFQH